jgi:hypothetical protein
VLGVVENMSGLRQPLPSFKFFSSDGRDVTEAVLHAAAEAVGGSAGVAGDVFAETDVFAATGGGAARMAADMQVPFLGRVPMDSALSMAGEQGRSVFDSSSKAACGPALQHIIDELLGSTVEKGGKEAAAGPNERANGTG